MKDYRQVHAQKSVQTAFLFDEMCNYQLLADSFLENYNHLAGRDGILDYMHLHKAGHCAYFLLLYGNVYKYSQQGYETVNEVMRREFDTNT